jgi:acyl carrier protein
LKEDIPLSDNDIRADAEALIIESLVQFGYDRSELSGDTVLVTLDVSSLDIMELIQVIRHRFGIILEAHRIAACNTLNAVVDLVVKSVEDVQNAVS